MHAQGSKWEDRMWALVIGTAIWCAVRPAGGQPPHAVPREPLAAALPPSAAIHPTEAAVACRVSADILLTFFGDAM